MTPNQALAIINLRRESSEGGIYYLVCGFEPLRLATLLRAHLLESRAGQKNLEVHHGVYGDLRGNIESAVRSPAVGRHRPAAWPAQHG